MSKELVAINILCLTNIILLVSMLLSSSSGYNNEDIDLEYKYNKQKVDNILETVKQDNSGFYITENLELKIVNDVSKQGGESQ